MALVLRNGHAFDGERHRPGHGVVVDADRIVAVAPDDALPRGAGVTEVDLAGGLVAPGFVDAHVHAVQGGLERIRCDLSELTTRDDYLTAVRAYADAHPDLPWILGGGWAMAAFPGGTPTAADLDAVVPDRPVFLPNRDHHGAWVNSRALELAGIDATTPDPPDGRLERDADGRPDRHPPRGRHGPGHPVGSGGRRRGVLPGLPRRPAAPALRRCHRLAGRDRRRLRRHRRPLRHLPAGSGQRRPDGHRRRGAVVGPRPRHRAGRRRSWTAERPTPTVGCERRASRSCRTASPRTAPRPSALPTSTGAVTRPTTGGTPSWRRPRSGRRWSRWRPSGFQVHVHAIGDRGAREALDAFARARGVGGDLRHHIAHLQVIDPIDVPRFAELGVTANMQALWACLDEQMVELTLPFLGEERTRWQYPFGALRRAGASLAPAATGRSAHPTRSPRSTWPSTGRRTARRGRPAPSRSCRSRRSTWRRRSRRTPPARRGSATATTPDAWPPAREADLVVLDRDPFAGPEEEIGAARVVGTWVDGRRVHG